MDDDKRNLFNEIDELLLNEIKSMKLQNNPTNLIQALVNTPMICSIPILDVQEIFPLNSKLENSIFLPSDLASRELRQELIESYEAMDSTLERTYFIEELEFNSKIFEVYYETKINELESNHEWLILSMRYKNANMDEILLAILISKYALSDSIIALRVKHSPSSEKEVHKGIEDLLLNILSKK